MTVDIFSMIPGLVGSTSCFAMRNHKIPLLYPIRQLPQSGGAPFHDFQLAFGSQFKLVICIVLQYHGSRHAGGNLESKHKIARTTQSISQLHMMMIMMTIIMIMMMMMMMVMMMSIMKKSGLDNSDGENDHDDVDHCEPNARCT